MSAPFVSLNSWLAPGWLLQAAEPVEIVVGRAGEWARLEDALRRHRRENAVAQVGNAARHPAGGAVGFVNYEGDFWFGIFPDWTFSPAGQPTRLWSEQRGVSSDGERRIGPWQANFSRANFESAVRAAQAHIAAGDIYQVNLAQRFAAEFSGSPHALFEQLLAASPAPGAAFIDTGAGTTILSASPELFLRVDPGGRITTRPIKGTRPRGVNPTADRQLATELQRDPKERAELLMITDLLRNDLGRVCAFGSVAAPDLLRLEHFAQVHHLVSTVTGQLRADVSPVGALAACFPGGSITGAPKKGAMEIIAELERATPRGVYTGAIGWFGLDGRSAAFSIAIRTLVHDARRGELHYHVGAGITADSVPAREWEETMHKGAGLRAAVARYAQAGTHFRGVPFVSEQPWRRTKNHGRFGEASLPL
ncbi:MAG: aminodeoxychorismate synthase component I, partial [Verrucomicrobia bacterium]|nr:aminodeoxychorismate synthase component I [Verrucomicrobiota bacterium]